MNGRPWDKVKSRVGFQHINSQCLRTQGFGKPLAGQSGLGQTTKRWGQRQPVSASAPRAKPGKEGEQWRSVGNYSPTVLGGGGDTSGHPVKLNVSRMNAHRNRCGHSGIPPSTSLDLGVLLYPRYPGALPSINEAKRAFSNILSEMCRMSCSREVRLSLRG